MAPPRFTPSAKSQSSKVASCVAPMKFDAGVAAQNVDVSELGFHVDPPPEPMRRDRLRRVARPDTRAPSRASACAAAVMASARLSAIATRMPAAGERAREAEPDAARRTRDECDLVLECVHESHLVANRDVANLHSFGARSRFTARTNSSIRRPRRRLVPGSGRGLMDYNCRPGPSRGGAPNHGENASGSAQTQDPGPRGQRDHAHALPRLRGAAVLRARLRGHEDPRDRHALAMPTSACCLTTGAASARCSAKCSTVACARFTKSACSASARWRKR